MRLPYAAVYAALLFFIRFNGWSLDGVLFREQYHWQSASHDHDLACQRAMVAPVGSIRIDIQP
jgi:hypothetical protein